MYGATETALPWLTMLAFMAALILLNEFSRRWKWAMIAGFVVLPVCLTIFVWIPQAGESETLTWFTYAKVYSALAGAIICSLVAYSEKLRKNKVMLCLPPLILAINITEAVVRDFTIVGVAPGMYGDVFRMGGAWNYMNGIAGILNILTICGWFGITVSKDPKRHDMMWPDMMWFWVVAYDLWNFAYVYNNSANYSPFNGIALLLACTIPSFIWAKGAWLQHRAFTLSWYTMFVMTFPGYASLPAFAVPAAANPAAYLAISSLSLCANVAVFAYQLHRVAKLRKNPLRDELYADTEHSLAMKAECEPSRADIDAVKA